jgi:hypothetical protein
MEFGRRYFLDQLRAAFPEILRDINENQEGLLHCEVAVFRQATEAAMDGGRLCVAQEHFSLLEEMLAVADPNLRNALEISYLEDLALGECTPARQRAVNERMPRAMRHALLRHHDQWR